MTGLICRSHRHGPVLGAGVSLAIMEAELKEAPADEAYLAVGDPRRIPVDRGVVQALLACAFFVQRRSLRAAVHGLARLSKTLGGG